MESMRDIRTRMTSVQKTMKITNAMYLMASSKLKKAKARLAGTAPYFNKLQDTIADILYHSEAIENKFIVEDVPEPAAGDGRKRGYIVITSDKGLAGAYNHNVTKMTEAELKKGGDNTLYFIGFAGKNYFRRKKELGKNDEEHNYAAVDPDIWRAYELAGHVINEYKNGNLDEVYVVYTKMRNALASDAEMLRILPLSRHMFNYKAVEGEKDFKATYMPSPDAVLAQVVPNYVKGLLYGAMVEAFASEQNARMAAMDNATENAKEIVKELSLHYNRVRQAAITTELNDIVGGANAQE
jgi:F-type H+-transporting ATPase subunit gamma